MSLKEIKDFIFNQEIGIFVHPDKIATNYQDGSEDYVLSVLKDAEDTRAYSTGLSRHIKDWPSRYHFSIKRINLMESVKDLLNRNSKVLEIGCGTGPITRWLGEQFAEVDAIEGEQNRALAARYRTRDLRNVNVFCGDVLKTSFEEGKYGLITIIGVLEYIPFFESGRSVPEASCMEFLKRISSSLQDDGMLLLAIENKFGAKYFSGCKEDHTGREFDGLIDYPNKSAVTFSRNELREMLISSGLENIQFYHLFPDYKLPETIIMEDDEVLSLYPYNWIKTPFEDYSGQRRHIFPELLFLKSATKAKQLWDFSNSFLVLAGKSGKLNLKADWLIKKFYDREPHKPVFHHTAAVVKNPEKGYLVERKPLYFGESEYSAKDLTYNLEGKTAFVYGDSLRIDVNRAVMSHDYRKNLEDIIGRINDTLVKEFGTGEVDDAGYPLVTGEAIDYGFFNIIKSEDGNYNFIDRKWKFRDAIPADFVLYRNLYHVKLFFGPFIPADNSLDIVEVMKRIYPAYDHERAGKNARLEELFQSEVNLVANLGEEKQLPEASISPNKIRIPGTTLVCIDCINHELSIRAIEQCLAVCNFDRAIFFTDRDYNLGSGINVIKIPAIATKEEYSRFVIKELVKYIDTDFVLMVQYDGFVLNPAAWTDEFRKYDYIGAKWHWYNDGFNVGNGGFSLRSRRLLQALRDDSIKADSVEYGEDTLICRTYRTLLENKYGIKFAPEALADRFSYERSGFTGDHPFGFHGLFNMWRYIPPQHLQDFINELSPRTLKAVELTELGMNFQETGQLKEAEIVFSKILQYHPQHQGARTTLEMVRQQTHKTITSGRNAPCPCGSGRKYKKCCGGKERE